MELITTQDRRQKKSQHYFGQNKLVKKCETLLSFFQSSLDDATDDWGIKVERVEIKDVKLPLQLQRAMAAEAEASREARAKVSYFFLKAYDVALLWFPSTPLKGAVNQSNDQISSVTLTRGFFCQVPCLSVLLLIFLHSFLRSTGDSS